MLCKDLWSPRHVELLQSLPDAGRWVREVPAAFAGRTHPPSLAQAEIGAVMGGLAISNPSPKVGISRCFAREERVELSGNTNFLQNSREEAPKTSISHKEVMPENYPESIPRISSPLLVTPRLGDNPTLALVPLPVLFMHPRDGLVCCLPSGIQCPSNHGVMPHLCQGL